VHGKPLSAAWSAAAHSCFYRDAFKCLLALIRRARVGSLLAIRDTLPNIPPYLPLSGNILNGLS
jgi:hypothetical protein